MQHVHTLAARRSHGCGGDSGRLAPARWVPTPVWRRTDGTVVDCCTWQEQTLHFDVLNCLEFKSLSPLYECLISKVSSSALNCGHRRRVPCLNGDSASSTAYVPWDYRTPAFETATSLLIWRGRRKRIDQAAAQGEASEAELHCGVVPGTWSPVPGPRSWSWSRARARGAWAAPGAAVPTLTAPHWQSRTLNDMMLTCHSGWAADAIFTLCGHCTTKCS